jgi:hypothetical protein
MSWFVQQGPYGWTVFHRESRVEVGYHGTEQEANSHLAALYASAVPDDDLDALYDDLDDYDEDDES